MLDISYPIVQGADNEYYLHNTVEKNYNFAGSIFADAANAGDFSDHNTIPVSYTHLRTALQKSR